MAKIEGEVACAACGQMLRVTLTKKRLGDAPPPAEYEVTGESVAIAGLFPPAPAAPTDEDEGGEEGEDNG